MKRTIRCMILLAFGFIWLLPIQAEAKNDPAAAKQGALINDIISDVIGVSANGHFASSPAKNICNMPSSFNAFLDKKLNERYDFTTEQKVAFIKTVDEHLKVTCKSYKTTPPTSGQAKTLIGDAVKNALKALKKTNKEKAENEGVDTCTCKNITSFKQKDIATIDRQILSTCHDKLYSEQKKWQATKLQPTCAERFGVVHWKLDQHKKNKLSVINDVLSFKPNTFDFHLNAGYAFTTVNTLWSKGHPRISLGMYRTFSSANHTDPMDPDNYGWFNNYGAHLATEIKLTDTAEEQAVNTKTVGVKLGNKRALEFESLLLVPAYMGKVSMYGKDRDYFFGPAALWAAKKIGQSTATVDNKYMFTSHYFGFRAAAGPESYTDVMLGRSEGVSGTRLMIRGQMPFNIPNTDQVIFLGLEGNIAIKNRKANASAETIRGYMTYRFDRFFDAFKVDKTNEEE